MTKYQVIDGALLQIAQGDQVFEIDENGEVDLPTNVALDLLSAGQIEKIAEGKHDADAKAPGKPKAKAKAKAGADPENGDEDADAEDEGKG